MINPRIPGAALVSLGTSFPIIHESARNRPTLKSTVRRTRQIDDAFDRHLQDIKPGSSLTYQPYEIVPSGTTYLERLGQVVDKPLLYSGSSGPSKPPSVGINPNADRSLFAHELGHLASQQTKVGHLAASLRENPMLSKALMGSLLTLPGVAAALTPGDGDLEESLAVAALTTAPTLIDEGLATTHGLSILNKAGLRASLGQRGILAGGLLSYLAPSIIAGVAGNKVGNLFDSDPAQTDATLNG